MKASQQAMYADSLCSSLSGEKEGVGRVSDYTSSSHTARESVASDEEGMLAAKHDGTRPVDGLFGWIPTLAVAVNYMFVFGASNSYGVFSTYYLNVKFAGTPATTLSWIGTSTTSVMLICNLFTGSMADKKGYRVTAYTGTAICTLAYILASFSKKVWQLILTQGVLLGIGLSFLIAPSFSIPSQWFSKRRGLASGIAMAGSSIGGLWFTAATQTMIDNLGAEWALRILGLLTLVVTSLMNSLYYRRVPAKPRIGFLELGATKRLVFWLVSLEQTLMDVGFWVVAFYIGTAARQVGGTSQDGANMLLVLNAASVIGRVMAGGIADWFGSINTLLASYVLTSTLLMSIWLTATGIPSLFVLCALYGLISPTFIALNPIIISTQIDTDALASVVGMVNSQAGLGILAGNLAQGAIFDKYDNRKQFDNTVIFSGTFIALASVTTFVLRSHVIGKRVDKLFFQKV
ncbi:hypothetical protein GGI20_000225 [Coemansia sp. BCRC 34301]|nr:hypothetical protein GGI20_000225 [Coemansia sp. BCRC 34301]